MHDVTLTSDGIHVNRIESQSLARRWKYAHTPLAAEVVVLVFGDSPSQVHGGIMKHHAGERQEEDAKMTTFYESLTWACRAKESAHHAS